jgi:hypothetical protein
VSAEALLAPWQAAWPRALATWSRVVKLSEPRWCLSPEREREEGLTSSFAMIRLVDHAVVISLRQVDAMALQDYAVEVLAHEIGHHLYAPGDLGDHGRLLARMRRGLPGREREAPLIANLYTDLLINDRLQRVADLRMLDIYRRMRVAQSSLLWAFYMRIYEHLWGLPRGELAPVPDAPDPLFELDAELGARMVRVHGKDWLAGGGGFAALCFPYLDKDDGKSRAILLPLLDTEDVGDGDTLPGGLAELDDEELDGPLHPRLDPRINGLPDDDGDGRGGRRKKGGKEPPPDRIRPPGDFRDLARSLGVKLSDEELTSRYYRELAVPHLVPFPERIVQPSTDPLPESLESWDAGSPAEELDLVESLLQSPIIIPGYTTVRRVYGTTEGATPERQPLDLYLGVDCSGSMGNPANTLSYPILGGAIVTLSALRAGARVKAVLSGEPGGYTGTPDFVRDERAVLRVLTAYLGTGYTFGIPRLAETFTEERRERPAHILIVTDSDIYMMLEGKDGRVGERDGWKIAEESLARAGGGGTMVLHGHPGPNDARRQRLIDQGWAVHLVASEADLVRFAADFAARHYQERP